MALERVDSVDHDVVSEDLQFFLGVDVVSEFVLALARDDFALGLVGGDHPEGDIFLQEAADEEGDEPPLGLVHLGTPKVLLSAVFDVDEHHIPTMETLQERRNGAVEDCV